MAIINNPTLASNIEKVANWIVDECDDTKGEVEWLLEKLFAEQVEWVKEIDHCRTLNEDITSVYDSVFEHLKNKESEVE
jgi:malonyl CoA-acyl carrier protein transacylase